MTHLIFNSCSFCNTYTPIIEFEVKDWVFRAFVKQLCNYFKGTHGRNGTNNCATTLFYDGKIMLDEQRLQAARNAGQYWTWSNYLGHYLYEKDKYYQAAFAWYQVYFMEQSLSDGQEIHGSQRSNWTWRGNAHATQRSSLHWGHGNTTLNLYYAVRNC